VLRALLQQRAATLCRPHRSIVFQRRHLPSLSSARPTSIGLPSDFRRTPVGRLSDFRRTSVGLPSNVRPTSILRPAYVIVDVTTDVIDGVIILLSCALTSYACCPVSLTYYRPTSCHLTSYNPTFYALWSCILWICVLQLILLHSAVVLSCD
jgi:hypothetical protein